MSTVEKITDFLNAESSPYPTDCYAVPGSDSIIDTIHPETGLTTYFAKTLEQVRAEKGDELAERMTIEQFCEEKAARQHTPITWEPMTEEKYYEMFEVLPPIIRGNGFLVSEPWDHDAQTGAPRYGAYRRNRGYDAQSKECNLYEAANRPMTVKEFEQVQR
jgi:hypothetical protein